MDDAHPQPVASSGAAPPPPESRLGWLGIAFAGLYLASVYVKVPFLRPGVTVGDLIDVVTPLILILLFARVARAARSGGPGTDAGSAPIGSGARMLLILGGFALVLGHGMHVAANSIDDAIARARIPDPGGLIDWWDEHVAHFTIDGSKVALCLGLTALELRGTSGAAPGSRRIFLAGAVAYGFIYFAAGVEGQTVALLLPFSVAYLVWAIVPRRPFPPVRLFYTLAALVSILLFAVWGIWHHGFPEFSTVGLIPNGS